MIETTEIKEKQKKIIKVALVLDQKRNFIHKLKDWKKKLIERQRREIHDLGTSKLL